MSKCKHYDSCGLDYCSPEIVREGIECPHYEPKERKIKMIQPQFVQTNGDRIRAMSNEELDKEIRRLRDWLINQFYTQPDKTASEILLAWLNKPVEGGT